MPGSLSPLLWLVTIVALVPVALWLLKRTSLAPTTVPGTPRHVAALPLSPSQSLVTVEVGTGEERRWLVLGVSAQGIRTLHTMVPAAPAPVQPPPQAAFASLLERLRRPAGTTDAH